MASSTGYVIGGALGGAVVKIIFSGDYSFKTFLSGFASIILGSSLTILLIHFFPDIGRENVVISSLASVITAASGGIFKRMHTMKVKASVGGIEAESNGEDEK